MTVLGIEAGNVLVARTPCFEKNIPVLHADLFDGFQTVSGKAGAYHLHRSHTLARERLQRFVGIGLQPFLAAKP